MGGLIGNETVTMLDLSIILRLILVRGSNRRTAQLQGTLNLITGTLSSLYHDTILPSWADITPCVPYANLAIDTAQAIIDITNTVRGGITLTLILTNLNHHGVNLS